ncbi:MAG: hypothetical protein Q4B15_06565 [Lachnospiraceae bacterium]|nr:hypothetical protein [Lachnospiraceae bacterium]
MTLIATDKYQFLEKEDFTLDFAVEGILQKAEEEYLPAFYKSIAAGVVLCVISPVPLLIFSSAEDEITAEYMSVFGVAVLLTIVACGVFLIVRVCILKGAYDRLLQKGDYTVSKKRAGKKLNAFSGAYWSLLTALYLLVSFLTMRWDMTWIIWPVGAVAFAALYAILESVVADK